MSYSIYGQVVGSSSYRIWSIHRASGELEAVTTPDGSGNFTFTYTNQDSRTIACFDTLNLQLQPLRFAHIIPG